MNLAGFSIFGKEKIENFAQRPTVRSHIPIRVFQRFLFPIDCFKLLRIPKRHECFSRGKREKRG